MRSITKGNAIILAAAWITVTAWGSSSGDATMAANKQVVVDFYHAVFNGHDAGRIKDFVSPEFVQHNPTAPPGRDGLIQALSARWPNPLPAGSFALTKFDLIITQGDLVQLMERRALPDPARPGEKYDSFWFGLYRLKDGKIIEHWDSDRK